MTISTFDFEPVVKLLRVFWERMEGYLPSKRRAAETFNQALATIYFVLNFFFYKKPKKNQLCEKLLPLLLSIIADGPVTVRE